MDSFIPFGLQRCLFGWIDENNIFIFCGSKWKMNSREARIIKNTPKEISSDGVFRFFQAIIILLFDDIPIIFKCSKIIFGCFCSSYFNDRAVLSQEKLSGFKSAVVVVAH